MTQEKVFGCHVIILVTSGTVPWSFPCPWAGGQRGGLIPCVDRQLLPKTTAVGSHVPPLSPPPIDLPSQGAENDSHLKVLRLHIVFI